MDESFVRHDAVLDETKQFERKFFSSQWSAMTGQEGIGIEELGISQEKAVLLYETLVPAMDAYIEKYQIPTEPLDEETFEGFMTRAVGRMYQLNQQHKGCWSDCWPTTALELGRTNCAYGSLVLARALNRAGVPLDAIDYATPGPLSHAAIIVNNLYADQANGVVIPAEPAGVVGNIKCYRLNLSEQSPETNFKVPFRLVPVHDVATGVRSLVSNLDPLIGDALSGNQEAIALVDRFGVWTEKVYGQYAFEQLMPAGWKRSELMSYDAWKTEFEESSKRIKGEGIK